MISPVLIGQKLHHENARVATFSFEWFFPKLRAMKKLTPFSKFCFCFVLFIYLYKTTGSTTDIMSEEHQGAFSVGIK